MFQYKLVYNEAGFLLQARGSRLLALAETGICIRNILLLPLDCDVRSVVVLCFQLQTLCADEPMTTFVLCNECGNRWKVITVV